MNKFINEIKPFSPITKPIFRWVGGKTWSLKILNSLISKVNYLNYFEPFFGGGALFFSFKQKNKSYLSDINKDLITTYKMIKSNPSEILKKMDSFSEGKDFYYKIREENPTCEINIAARFIYLNKTSFNGIYRVNQKGKFNVPYGEKSINKEVLSNHLEIVSEKLHNAEIFISDFESSLKKIKKNDLVYLDPPYTVTHNQNGFIKYNEKLFSKDDQLRLSNYIDKIKSKGAFYILSNANHQFIKEIFSKNDKVFELERNSSIGSKIERRGLYSELLITNIKN